MRMNKLLFTVVLLGIYLPCFSAEYETGNYWDDQCNHQGREGYLRCAAFATGGLGGFQLHAQIVGVKADFCIPESATIQQTTDVFAAYLRDNPNHGHQLAVALLAVALRKVFPCER